MTTEEARRERQVRLVQDTEEMLDVLHRLEGKIDIGQKTIRRVRSAVNIALVAVIASVTLWYGQARAQSDASSFIKCVATWADTSTHIQDARSTANATRIKFEKARGDALFKAIAENEKGVAPAKSRALVDKAESDYNKAYQNYQDTIARNPIPDSPKFTCAVEPFHLTSLQIATGAAILLVLGLAMIAKLARTGANKLMERRRSNDRSDRDSRSHQ